MEGGMEMNVAIRIDASITIGTGHVMRCLTLANLLFKRGARVTFLCRAFEGNMLQFIASQGFATLELPIDGDDVPLMKHFLHHLGVVDWLIIDHYEIDDVWEKQMRPYVAKIMVIDDLANRQHDCDVLLDQNYWDKPRDRYSGLVPSICRLFVGPSYTLIRPEFKEAGTALEHREKSLSSGVNRVLVFFSGSDPTDETRKALRALASDEFSELIVDVVVGATNPYRDSIQELCEKRAGFRYHFQIDYMAELMASADLSIGAGGSTTWERCFMRLPAIVIVLAENQREVTDAVTYAGAIYNLGWHAEVTEEMIRAAVRTLMTEPQHLLLMRKACEFLFPKGEIKELIEVLMECYD
jgi:UDP-2,4-diacetamido-2,4,6-trideoxy-beta-L-altropyranose hydrolase